MWIVILIGALIVIIARTVNKRSYDKEQTKYFAMLSINGSTVELVDLTES